MDIELHLQVWKELRNHFTGSDSDVAAEDFVRVLIEHGANADDIAEYAIDDEIKTALMEYTELEEDDDDDDDDDDDFNTEYN